VRSVNIGSENTTEHSVANYEKNQRSNNTSIGSDVNLHYLQNVDNVADEDEFYKSLASSISTYNNARLPTFIVDYTFNSSAGAKGLANGFKLLTCPFFDASSGYKVLPNGYIALWGHPCYGRIQFYNVCTNQLIASFDHSYSWDNTPYNICSVDYLAKNKIIIVYSLIAIILYKLNDDGTIVLINKSFEFARAISVLTDDTFVIIDDFGIKVSNDDGNVIAEQENIYVYVIATNKQNLIAISTKMGITIYEHFRSTDTQKGNILKLRTLHSDKWCTKELVFVNPELLAAVTTDDYFNFSISIWNVNSASLLCEIPLLNKLIYQLLPLPNGWLCSVDDDSTNNLKIWNIYSKKQEASLSVTTNQYFHKYISLTHDDYLVIPLPTKIAFIDVSVTNDKKVIPSQNLSFPSNIRFKIFRIHNLLKDHPNKALLSKSKISDLEIPMILGILRYSSSITELNLSYNNISASGIKQISEIIHDRSVIKYLILSGIQINLCSFDYFVKALGTTENKTLSLLDLSKNLIKADAEELEEIKDKIEKSHCTIDLSQNYLSDQCDPLFEEEKGETSSFKYSFFKSRPQSLLSQIDPTKTLSINTWIVGLASPKDEQHSIIFIEGMSRSGQIILERYEIGTRDIFGSAKVAKSVLSPNEFSSHSFFIKTLYIDDVQGQRLRKLIDKKIGTKVPFSKCASRNSNTVNCVEWSLKQLAEVNIIIDRPYIPTPINVARGYSSCTIA
jgi:hypothetical protein